VCCYNDDIQGTGSVILAVLYNALKISKGHFKDQRILMLALVLPASDLRHDRLGA